jgi:hypothetical protein
MSIGGAGCVAEGSRRCDASGVGDDSESSAAPRLPGGRARPLLPGGEGVDVEYVDAARGERGSGGGSAKVSPVTASATSGSDASAVKCPAGRPAMAEPNLARHARSRSLKLRELLAMPRARGGAAGEPLKAASEKWKDARIQGC